MTAALLIAAQLCAVAPTGGIAASESRAAFNHAIAAGADGIAVTWLERRAPGPDSSFPPGGREETAVGRVFTAAPALAPTGPGAVVGVQGAVDAFLNGVAPIAPAAGGLWTAGCNWAAFAGRFGCAASALTGAEPPEPANPAQWHIDGNGPVDDHLAAVEAPGGALIAVPVGVGNLNEDFALHVIATATRHRVQVADAGSSVGNVDAPAMVRAGADGAAVLWRSRAGISARMVGNDASPRGAIARLSNSGARVGAPAVAWISGSAHAVFAARASDRAPWALAYVRWTPGSPPTRATLATGAQPAVAPAIVPAPDGGGCALVAWTEGTGHTTIARVGRVCNDALVPASVATVSRPGVEAGDSELAVDGRGHAFALWQELPRGAPAELRLAAVACPR